MKVRPFRRVGWLLLGAALAASSTDASGAAAQGAELTATVTQLQGNVGLAGPGVPTPPRASLWQVLRAGVTISVPERGAVGVVCSTRRFVRLRGPVEWTLGERACAAGREVSPAGYSLVAAAPGFKLVNGLQMLNREMRGNDENDPLAPLLLAPRDTAVRTARPAVAWLRVPGAVQYLVEWQGSDVQYADRLAAESVACAAGPEGMEACTVPWPADRPDLPAGKSFFLKVASREETTASWRDQGSYQVRTLPAADGKALEDRLSELVELGLEGSALAEAQAGLLAAEGIYGEAAALYRQALAGKAAGAPAAELRVALADLDAAMGLFQLAEPEYRQALREGSPAVQAAASYGLGHIEYARRLFREAVSDFERACELYSRQPPAQGKNDRKVACEALEKARARLPHPQ